MMVPLLLAAAAAAPQPAELKVFQDWTVGCDNGRSCHAVALTPEDWPDDALTMSVRRRPEGGAAPVIAFDLGEDNEAAELAADGKRLPVRLVRADMTVSVHPADAGTAIAALRSARKLEVLAADGASLGTVSLKGASAALLYMDEQQRRIGTATALVRAGAKPASTVPRAPALPVIRGIEPRGTPLPLTAASIRTLRKQAKCEIGEVGGPDSHEAVALDPNRTLVLLACGSGAYNVSTVPYVATRRGGRILFEAARFDAEQPWWREEGKPILINGEWDSAEGRLASFSKGRGLGDCGETRSYAWDGARFRLVEQAEMGECRGSVDYITTWRARVVR